MHLSYSRISTLLRCPRQFELKYIQKVEHLVSPYLYLGGSAHEAIAWAYRQKMEGEEPHADHLKSMFAEIWDTRKFLEDQEEPKEVDWNEESPGELRETGALLCSLYWQKIAPHIQPADVEVPFRKDIGGITLVGRIDLITGTGKLVDLKTKKRGFGEAEVRKELQPCLYALAMGSRGNIEFDFHQMVKTKVPYVSVVSTRRSAQELAWVANQLLPRVARAIETGSFYPNVQSFLCSPENCETWHWCRGG